MEPQCILNTSVARAVPQTTGLLIYCEMLCAELQKEKIWVRTGRRGGAPPISPFCFLFSVENVYFPPPIMRHIFFKVLIQFINFVLKFLFTHNLLIFSWCGQDFIFILIGLCLGPVTILIFWSLFGRYFIFFLHGHDLGVVLRIYRDLFDHCCK